MAQPLQRFSTEGSSQGPTCWPCRFAKRKCDRQVPCSRCRRFDLHCVPQLRGRGRPPNNPGHRPKTRQRRVFDPPSTRSRAKLTMGEGEMGADGGTSDDDTHRGGGGGGGSCREDGARVCVGMDGMEEEWVSGKVCHVQEVKRPFADLDPVKSVSLSITEGLKSAYSTGTLDGAKLAAALLGIEFCNKRCGRDSARYIRDTLNWAIRVAQPAFPTETALTNVQHTMDSEYLKHLADENVCYVEVTLASHTATIVTSKLMEEVFASGEELMDFIDQTGLVYFYAFTRFVAAASIGPLIEALSVQAFQVGYYGCVHKIIEAQDRVGRHVRCLASVARRVSIGDKSLTIVLRLLPLMNNPSFVANRPQFHTTSMDEGARVSSVGVHGGSQGDGCGVGRAEGPVLIDGALRSCQGDALTVIIAPPASTPPPPADAASAGGRSDVISALAPYRELSREGQPLSQGSGALPRDVRMERWSEQQRPLMTPQVSSPSSEAGVVHVAHSEARHADMQPYYVYRPSFDHAIASSTEVEHAHEARRAHVLSGGGWDVCGSDGQSFGSSSPSKPSHVCISSSSIAPDMHDAVVGTCYLLGEETESGWASMRFGQASGAAHAGTACGRQGGARYSMHTSAEQWPMYRPSIPERAIGQYHSCISSLSSTDSATTVDDHVNLSVKPDFL